MIGKLITMMKVARPILEMQLTHIQKKVLIRSVSQVYFPRIYFNNQVGHNKYRIIAINQWGTNPWSSMESAFAGCARLEGQATDSPDLSKVLRTSSMFQGARRFNQDIGNWDVSNVQNMNSMFQYCSCIQPRYKWLEGFQCDKI